MTRKREKHLWLREVQPKAKKNPAARPLTPDDIVVYNKPGRDGGLWLNNAGEASFHFSIKGIPHINATTWINEEEFKAHREEFLAVALQRLQPRLEKFFEDIAGYFIQPNGKTSRL